MGLIKSQSAPGSLAPFSMADIAKQANGILARAQSRADAMLAEAQIAAEELRSHAHAEGVIAGQREGIAYGLRKAVKPAVNRHWRSSGMILRRCSVFSPPHAPN